MMTTDDKVKQQTLEGIIQAGTHRELTGQEQRYISWLCQYDEETYQVFKGIFTDMQKG